ncbi:uncharacterized protein LOC129790016 [Lutzomyia longipalpis]|uniref:uncharacterized protein LOC129790016 n=1 Tax=Lutzomyia longipalpis TaxID=7200 RepID=UPI002483CF5C|nr:uncharacterized protein LOC129790016 [Lutzomyia longipalpis]
MDFIDLTNSSEENAAAPKSMPAPLLPPVENFEGRMSIGGDPFEKMLTEAKLHSDPFECLRHTTSAISLTTNLSDLEIFLQESANSVSPGSINHTFMFCDISPITNTSEIEPASVLNNAFVHMSSKLPGMSSKPTIRKRTESAPVATEKGSDERKSRSVTVEKIKMKSPEPSLWHSIASEVQEDLMSLAPPPLFEENDEDSLENLKIPILEQINAAEEQPQNTEVSSSPEKLPTCNSVLETSAVVEDLRRRMKDVLNMRITSNDLDITGKSEEKSMNDRGGILRQDTFSIDKGQKKLAEDTAMPEKKTSAPADESFMEKLMVMCGEHNVSIVQDASQMEKKNQSMIVVYVNKEDSSKTEGGQLKRRNSFSSDIPRATLSVKDDSGSRRRRSVTTVATPGAREWKYPVGRVLPSPNFRGQPLKIRGGDVKPRTTVGPLKALRPTPKINVDENVTPPERGAKKRRSLVTTSTPKVGFRKPVDSSTPQLKLPPDQLAPAKLLHRRQSTGPKKCLTESNNLHPRYTPSK